MLHVYGDVRSIWGSVGELGVERPLRRPRC